MSDSALYHSHFRFSVTVAGDYDVYAALTNKEGTVPICGVG